MGSDDRPTDQPEDVDDNVDGARGDDLEADSNGEPAASDDDTDHPRGADEEIDDESGEPDDDQSRRRSIPLLVGIGVSIIAGLVVGVLALTGAFGGDSETASCSFGIDDGTTFEGPARNETGGFDGQAAITMTAVENDTCTVTFDIVWSDGLSGRGDTIAGIVDESGAGVASGVFVWDDGDYALRIETIEVSAEAVRGTYEITAVEGGPTVAVGVGTFDTSSTEVAAS